MIGAVAAVGCRDMGMVVFALGAQCEVVRRLPYEYRAGRLPGQVEALLAGEYALEEAWSQLGQRFAVLQLGSPLGNGVCPHGMRLFVLGFRQGRAAHEVGYPLPADALDVVERNRHVLGAEIQIDLAAVVAVGARAPFGADHAMVFSMIGQFGQGRHSVLFRRDALHDVDQSVQARIEGLARVDRGVMAIHRRVRSAR